LTDLSFEEFQTLKSYQKKHSSYSFVNLMKAKAIVPSSLDWNELGAISYVKNQGECGAGWSFSVIGSIESAYYIKKGKMVEFSEQQLIDCSKNTGCSRGIMDEGFKYIMENGICKEEDYKYENKNNKYCKYCKTFTKIDSFVNVISNDENELLKAIVIQPLSVAIDAEQPIFQFYSSGIITTKCGTNLDHGVLLVGYGEKNGIDYWKLKNSWGETWGEEGYFYLERNVKMKEGKCGVAMDASYPIIE
jgi:KDEL-tailed cysteine endopeptidase